MTNLEGTGGPLRGTGSQQWIAERSGVAANTEWRKYCLTVKTWSCPLQSLSDTSGSSFGPTTAPAAEASRVAGGTATTCLTSVSISLTIASPSSTD